MFELTTVLESSEKTKKMKIILTFDSKFWCTTPCWKECDNFRSVFVSFFQPPAISLQTMNTFISQKICQKFGSSWKTNSHVQFSRVKKFFSRKVSCYPFGDFQIISCFVFCSCDFLVTRFSVICQAKTKEQFFERNHISDMPQNSRNTKWSEISKRFTKSDFPL